MNEWSAQISLRDLVLAAQCGVPEIAACWVIADTHFFHDNLRGYTGRPEDVDALIAERWRERVAPNDTVIHLGDLAFGHPDRLAELLPTLPGRLLLLKGNHDRQRDATYEHLGVTLIPPCTIPLADWTLALTHAPHMELLGPHIPRLLNVHGHIHEKLAPDLQLINAGVEWTEYAPVRLRQLAAARIAILPDPPAARSFIPPPSYAEWLARSYGGDVQRSDLTRFSDPVARAAARESYRAFRLAYLAAVLEGRAMQ